MALTVYLPDSEPGPEIVHLAPSPRRSPDCASRCSTTASPTPRWSWPAPPSRWPLAPARRVELVTKKGPQGRSANAAIPCAPDIFEQVLAQADVVITGTADCGSCTAYSVYDTIELEKAGRPCVVVTTTQFAPIAATMASSFGLPDARTLVLDHPIGGTARATLEQWADAATDRLVELFTQST